MRPMRRVLPIVVLAVGVGALPAAALDLSDYRQNTYGPPNHYCNPTRPLTSNGAGTLADPWNMSQCVTQPVAGAVVGILPGVSVDLPTTNSARIPAFNPTRSGTVNNRIVYVTKYAAVALSGVETNPNRTEFRHNGGPPSIVNGVGAGTGCAMLGAYQRHYITYDGFYIDMAEAYMKEDSGVLRAEGSTGIHFKNFVIKGAALRVASNAVIYRPGGAVDTVLSNFRAYDFTNDGTGSITPQPSLFSDQYGDQNVLIEHFEIRNMGQGIFFKGTAGNERDIYNYGTIRYGIVSGVTYTCFRFNALDPVHVTTVAHNLCYDASQAGLILSSENVAARNILIHHNTFARIGGSIYTNGGIYGRGTGLSSNVVIRDNLIDIESGRYGHGVEIEVPGLPATMNYNAYFKNGSPLSWAWKQGVYNSIATWRQATGLDANSQVLSSTPFVNRSIANFRVAAGHAAKTASSMRGEVGAYAGNEIPGFDSGGVSTSAPAAPTGLR